MARKQEQQLKQHKTKKSTSPKGGPTCKELKQTAKKLGVRRFSQMRKDELVKAIELQQKKDHTPGGNKQKTIHHCKKLLQAHGVHSINDFINYMISTYDPEVPSTVSLAKHMAECIVQMQKT